MSPYLPAAARLPGWSRIERLTAAAMQACASYGQMMDWKRDGYVISDDRERVDLEATWRFLRTAYWSPNVPRQVVERAIANSLCLGLYASDGSQAGFARLVTDRATFAWLADVFVLEPHRGRGLGAWLVETALAHPEIEGVRLTILGTADAHGLYERFGFRTTRQGEFMARRPALAELYGTPAANATE